MTSIISNLIEKLLLVLSSFMWGRTSGVSGKKANERTKIDTSISRMSDNELDDSLRKWTRK